MAAMASQHLPASILHGSNTDTDTDTVSVSVSSQLDSSNRQTLPPANHPAASSELDDELDSLDTLDSLLDDQFHHRFPDYHEHHQHSSHRSQTHHDARHSTAGSVYSPSASRPPSYRRSRFKSTESTASAATSLYSSRSSRPPRTSSLSHSSSSVPPLFANTPRASATPIKRKPLSLTASSLATAFQRSSVASSTAATISANTSVAAPVVPPLPHGAAQATATSTTTTADTHHDDVHDHLHDLDHGRLVDSHDSSRDTSRPRTAAKSYIADLPEPDTRFARPPSVDSPTLYHFAPGTPLDHLPAFQSLEDPSLYARPQSSASESRSSIPRDDPLPVHTVAASAADDFSDVLSIYEGVVSESSPDASSPATHANPLTRHDSYDGADQKRHDSVTTDSSTLMFAPKPTPPHLRLETVDTEPPHDDPDLDASHPDSPTPAPKLNKPLPKSPAGQTSPFSTFFAWGNGTNNPNGADFSPIPSPETPTRRGGLLDDPARPPPPNSLPTDPKTNAAVANPIGYCETQLSTPPPLAASSYIHLEEMEDELKAISSELAASIRREIDLEDLVDRLQDQANNAQAGGKRTSDYFSDSGYSSAKLSDYDQSREEIEKIQRRSEQEKASIRLELTNKLQDERQKIKSLDQQVKELAERASRIDLAEMNNMDANGRLKDLEDTCENLKRKLAEERSSKTNFEDLLTALKGELSSACSERDNLRDEVVPQLRARVEGLEAEAASYASLTYESTKMQHQLQSLQKENSSLRDSAAGIEDIASRGGLARSDSFFRNQRPTVSRNDSSANSKNAPAESREALAERLKDVEAQRDALHSALKNLLERQEFQNRENQKKIKILEIERKRLLSDSPQKAGFEKDISNLRTEVNVLRRRAEDAMEQKWQVEKGLGGLKMDLDRAEEEVTALRSMLKEKDILTAGNPGSPGGPSVTSEELEKAYKALQTQYNESLERIKKLENGLPGDDKTKQALQRLESSLNAALSERDIARGDASGLQNQYDKLASSSAQSMDSERALADELGESVVRVEQLASQVRSQLATNSELRQRLTDAVARSESDRKTNSDRIAGLQERLHGLEEQLVAAQTSSDERVAQHEEEVSKLKDAHNEQLRRLHEGGTVGIVGPRKGSLLNPANSMFNRAANALPPKNLEEEVEIQKLRARVTELEKALADADEEMQEVVSKMSTAQIEVMNLQEEREAAVRETRRLQGMLKQEQTSPFAGRLRALAVGA